MIRISYAELGIRKTVPILMGRRRKVELNLCSPICISPYCYMCVVCKCSPDSPLISNITGNKLNRKLHFPRYLWFHWLIECAVRHVAANHQAAHKRFPKEISGEFRKSQGMSITAKQSPCHIQAFEFAPRTPGQTKIEEARRK